MFMDKKTLRNCSYSNLWLSNPIEELRTVAEDTNCEISNIRSYGLVVNDIYFDVTGTINNIIRFKKLLS